MRTIIILAGLAAIIVLAIVGFFVVTTPPSLDDGSRVTVKIDRTSVRADVASSEASRNKGLAGRNPLQDTQGMLFIFPETSAASFWMKGMTFPIDIIWINNNTVIEVTPNLPPPVPGTADEQLIRYSPTGPVDQVVEVATGWAASHGIQPGDPVKITK